MKRALLHFVRCVGVPGFAVLALVNGTMLYAQWNSEHPVTHSLGFVVEFNVIALLVSYGMGASRRAELPYVLCTSCGKKSGTDAIGDQVDLSGWTCGYCKRESLVWVGRS